jgi:hypothetical protein
VNPVIFKADVNQLENSPMQLKNKYSPKRNPKLSRVMLEFNEVKEGNKTTSLQPVLMKDSMIKSHYCKFECLRISEIEQIISEDI